jgi:glycosyltransferase involved in cell wall biosynthesis
MYNKQNFIKRAIDSVFAQGHQDFELIIVNDGSTDNSLKIVEIINDFRLKIIDKPNGGVSSARNAGISVASNEWICFLDADDYWLPNHLDEISYLLKKYPEAKIYSTLTQEKSKKGLKIIPNSLEENFEGYVFNYFSFAKTATIFNSSSVCVNKIALLEVDKFV